MTLEDVNSTMSKFNEYLLIALELALVDSFLFQARHPNVPHVCVAVSSIQDVSVSDNTKGNFVLATHSSDILDGAFHISSRLRDRHPTALPVCLQLSQNPLKHCLYLIVVAVHRRIWLLSFPASIPASAHATKNARSLSNKNHVAALYFALSGSSHVQSFTNSRIASA